MVKEYMMTTNLSSAVDAAIAAVTDPDTSARETTAAVKSAAKHDDMSAATLVGMVDAANETLREEMERARSLVETARAEHLDRVRGLAAVRDAMGAADQAVVNGSPMFGDAERLSSRAKKVGESFNSGRVAAINLAPYVTAEILTRNPSGEIIPRGVPSVTLVAAPGGKAHALMLARKVLAARFGGSTNDYKSGEGSALKVVTTAIADAFSWYVDNGYGAVLPPEPGKRAATVVVGRPADPAEPIPPRAITVTVTPNAKVGETTFTFGLDLIAPAIESSADEFAELGI